MRTKLPARTLVTLLAAFSALTLTPIAATTHAAGRAASAQPSCPPGPAPPSSTSPTPGGNVLEPRAEQLVACVGSRPVTGALFRSWLTVARSSEEQPGKGATPTALVEEVMGYLISSFWVIGEARVRHVHVSYTEVHRTFEKLRHRAFPKHGEFGAFLKSSGESAADVLFRVRLNMLSQRLDHQVLARYRGASGRLPALARFLARFKSRWLARTYCEPAYAVPDCGHVRAPL